MLARSPVSCGAAPTYSDVSYYVAASGAGVFDAGTEDWICALPVAAGCPAPAPPAVRRAIQAATANILTAFAAGPCGPCPSGAGAHPRHRWPAAPARDHLTFAPICLQFRGL